MDSRVFRIGLLAAIFISIPVLLSVNFPPDECYWAGIVSLTIPLFVLLNFGGVLYFLVMRSKWLVVPGLILIASFPVYSKLVSLRGDSNQMSSTLSVLSFNVDSFKHFSRTNSNDFEINKQSFENWAKARQLDILCLQEMVELGNEPYIMKEYEKASSLKITKDGDHLGLFIFSKFPIIAEGAIEFAENSYNRLMWVDIVAFADTIRIANVHLMSYDFNNGTLGQNLRAMRTGVMARSWHTKLINQFVRNSPYPVLLMGDFNEAPYSHSYRSITSLLQDTFLSSGAGFDYTYVFLGLPFRIDHVFIDPQLKASHFQIIHGLDEWSNHSPVSVQIVLPD
ncbi:MAG: endonuclease/exonuclease/phosphatase family protein [Cyclobacteriaceae bacterium]|nr:endonuclease/exonuclease/phosphatase family protein [Cyclobacteriaceae bacterium]